MNTDNSTEMALIARITNVKANEKGEYPFTIENRHARFPLVLVHYKDDAVENVPFDAPIRKLRGTIIDTAMERIVCSSVGYISKVDNFRDMQGEPGASFAFENFFAEIEFNLREKKEISNKKISFSPIYEGTLIRVWRYRGELMYSSHRAIDCTNSHWGPSDKFLDLFKRYSSELNLDEMIVDGRVSSFILMNVDLLLASKMDFAGRSGFLIYTGTRPVINNDITYDFTFPCVTELANPDNADKHVFSPEVRYNWVPPTWRNFIVTCKMDDGVRLVRKIDPLYERELDLVGADANILRRMFVLTDDAKFPKGGDDRYMIMYPPVPVLTKDQIAGLVEPFKSFEEIPGTVYTAEQLTDKKDKDVHTRRIVNILTHYAMAIAPCHQLTVFRSIYRLLESRERLADFLFKNNQKFQKGDFGDYSKNSKDKKTCCYVQTKIKNTVSFVKKILGPKKVSKEDFFGMIKGEIFKSVMTYDNGAITYAMIRTFFGFEGF